MPTSATVSPSSQQRGAGRGDSPVADAALDLLVRAAATRPDRHPDLDQQLGRADDGLVRAGVELAHRHRRGCRSTPRITAVASTAANAADRSSEGSAWHSEPPTVPRLRTIGSAITRSASRKIG